MLSPGRYRQHNNYGQHLGYARNLSTHLCRFPSLAGCNRIAYTGSTSGTSLSFPRRAPSLPHRDTRFLLLRAKTSARSSDVEENRRTVKCLRRRCPRGLTSQSACALGTDLLHSIAAEGRALRYCWRRRSAGLPDYVHGYENCRIISDVMPGNTNGENPHTWLKSQVEENRIDSRIGEICESLNFVCSGADRPCRRRCRRRADP